MSALPQLVWLVTDKQAGDRVIAAFEEKSDAHTFADRLESNSRLDGDGFKFPVVRRSSATKSKKR